MIVRLVRFRGYDGLPSQIIVYCSRAWIHQYSIYMSYSRPGAQPGSVTDLRFTPHALCFRTSCKTRYRHARHILHLDRARQGWLWLNVVCGSEYVDMDEKRDTAMAALFNHFVSGVPPRGASKRTPLPPVPTSDGDNTEQNSQGLRIAQRGLGGLDESVDAADRSHQRRRIISPVVLVGLCLFALVILLLSVVGKCDGTMNLLAPWSRQSPVPCMYHFTSGCEMFSAFSTS